MSEAKSHKRLLDVICQVLENAERRKIALAPEVLHKAKQIIQFTTKPRKIDHLNALDADGSFSWETLRFGSPPRRGKGPLRFPRQHLMTVVQNAVSDAEEVERYNCDADWSATVRRVALWIGRTVEQVGPELQTLCYDLKQERELAQMEEADRDDETPWRDAVAKRRKPSKLASDLLPWDKPKYIDELLRLTGAGRLNDTQHAAIPKSEKRSLVQPPKKAFAAWQASNLAGLTQTDIAKQLKTNQPRISRMIRDACRYLDAGGVCPELPTDHPQLISTDPATLDMGKRIDPRTPKASDLHTE